MNQTHRITGNRALERPRATSEPATASSSSDPTRSRKAVAHPLRLAILGTALLSSAFAVQADNGIDEPTFDNRRATPLARRGIWSADTQSESTLPAADATIGGTYAGLVGYHAFSLDELTDNQRSAWSGIQNTPFDRTVYDTLSAMDAATARQALDNLSGEIHASTKTALFHNSRYVRDGLLAHLAEPMEPGDSLIAGRLWFDGWGHQTETKSDGNAAKLKNNGGGFQIGGDLIMPGHATVGMAIGYEHDKIEADSRNSTAKNDSWHIAGYAGGALGPIELKGGIAHHWVDIDTDRHIWVPNVRSTARSSYDARIFQAFIEAGHTFQPTEKASLTPYLEVAYVHLNTDSFWERGSNMALFVAGQTDDVTYTTLGLRGKYAATEKFSVQGNLGWQHASGDTEPSVTRHRFGNAYRSDISGALLAENSARIGIGLNWQLTNKSNLSFGYRGHFGDDTTDHSAHLHLDYRF